MGQGDCIGEGDRAGGHEVAVIRGVEGCLNGRPDRVQSVTRNDEIAPEANVAAPGEEPPAIGPDLAVGMRLE